ncbi:DUF1311 domain-containing protein [Thalassovita mediterranea]|nr:DUF1311 domain-containing protein [Thalassovita mediterranea]
MTRPFWTVATALALITGSSAYGQKSDLAGARGTTVLEDCLAEAEAGDRDRQSCVGKMYDACPGNAGSTLEMVTCITDETAFWDARLNQVYRELMALYQQQDAEFDDAYNMAARLRETQRGWIEWRDLKCRFAYDEFRGGTLGRITGADCIMNMTAERAFELEDLKDAAEM